MSQLNMDSFKQATVGLVIPHPDDEIFIGALALRLKVECDANVIVYPYSYGSDVQRQTERKVELTESLKVLGFALSESPSVENFISQNKPDILISPHQEDAHSTHIKCYVDCLAGVQSQSWNGTWIQTGFWSQPKNPNLAFQISKDDTDTLIAALKCHKGEILRNDYVSRLPAFWMDQVRLGSERVGGAGANGLTWRFGQMAEVYDVQKGALTLLQNATLWASKKN